MSLILMMGCDPRKAGWSSIAAVGYQLWDALIRWWALCW